MGLAEAEVLRSLSPGPCMAIAWVQNAKVGCVFPAGHPGTHEAWIEVPVEVPTRLLARVGASTIPAGLRVEWT